MVQPRWSRWMALVALSYAVSLAFGLSADADHPRLDVGYGYSYSLNNYDSSPEIWDIGPSPASARCRRST